MLQFAAWAARQERQTLQVAVFVAFQEPKHFVICSLGSFSRTPNAAICSFSGLSKAAHVVVCSIGSLSRIPNAAICIISTTTKSKTHFKTQKTPKKKWIPFGYDVELRAMASVNCLTKQRRGGGAALMYHDERRQACTAFQNSGGIRKKTKSLKLAKGSVIGARRFKAEDRKNIVILRKPQGLGFEGFTAGLKETVQFWPPALSWSSDCSSGKRRKDMLSRAEDKKLSDSDQIVCEVMETV